MMARIAVRLDPTVKTAGPENPREFLGDAEETEELA